MDSDGYFLLGILEGTLLSIEKEIAHVRKIMKPYNEELEAE